EPTVGGSSDVAEACWNTPTMGIVMPTMPLEVALPPWPGTACGGMSIGLSGALAAAKVLAMTALDVLTDADLRTAARADFERRTKGLTQKTPPPHDQKYPFALPQWMDTDGSTEAVGGMARHATTEKTEEK